MIQTRNLIPQFVAYLKDDLRRSRRTAEEYEKDLRAFVLWSANYATPLAIEDVTPQVFAAYASSMAQGGLSAATIQRRVSCARSFFRWLSLRIGRDVDPVRHIVTPKIPQRLVQPADETAVRNYLHTTPTTTHQEQVHFAVLMMYACGLRLSEVLSLSGSDFDLPARLVRVVGKGTKARWCSYDVSFAEYVNYYVGGSLDALFDNPCEATFRWAIIKTLTCNGRGISPHRIRHLYACRCLENGMPIKTLSMLLGHASVKTTERYLNVDRHHLADVSRQYAPSFA